MKNTVFLSLFLISFVGCNFESEVQEVLKPALPATAIKVPQGPLVELPVELPVDLPETPIDTQTQKTSSLKPGEVAKVAVPVVGSLTFLGFMYIFSEKIKGLLGIKPSNKKPKGKDKADTDTTTKLATTEEREKIMKQAEDTRKRAQKLVDESKRLNNDSANNQDAPIYTPETRAVTVPQNNQTTSKQTTSTASTQTQTASRSNQTTNTNLSGLPFEMQFEYFRTKGGTEFAVFLKNHADEAKAYLDENDNLGKRRLERRLWSAAEKSGDKGLEEFKILVEFAKANQMETYTQFMGVHLIQDVVYFTLSESPLYQLIQNHPSVCKKEDEVVQDFLKLLRGDHTYLALAYRENNVSIFKSYIRGVCGQNSELEKDLSWPTQLYFVTPY